MNCTQIYTRDDLPHLYSMASQLVWQQPENAKQEEHLDIFLVPSVKALLCRWRAQGLSLGRAGLTQQGRATSSHRNGFCFLQLGERWHWVAAALSHAPSLPKATTSQPRHQIQRNGMPSSFLLKTASAVLTFSTNRLVKCSIFSAQLFWDKNPPNISDVAFLMG